MTKRRWQHLDRERPQPAIPVAGEERAPPAEPPDAFETTPAQEPARSPELQRCLERGRALYQLFDYEECLAHLEPCLRHSPPDPELLRLGGSALALLGRLNEAAGHLETAHELSPTPLIASALLSVRLRLGSSPDVPAGEEGALGELSGAAAWLRGQQLVTQKSFSRAAAEFALAAVRFARSSPRHAVGERVAAAYVGQAVSSLLAGHLEAAQQAFGKLVKGPDVPAPLLVFARQLFEVAEACRELDTTERVEVLDALSELLGAVRLHVAFYDGRRPVELRWENLG